MGISPLVFLSHSCRLNFGSCSGHKISVFFVCGSQICGDESTVDIFDEKLHSYRYKKKIPTNNEERKFIFCMLFTAGKGRRIESRCAKHNFTS